MIAALRISTNEQKVVNGPLDQISLCIRYVTYRNTVLPYVRHCNVLYNLELIAENLFLVRLKEKSKSNVYHFGLSSVCRRKIAGKLRVHSCIRLK